MTIMTIASEPTGPEAPKPADPNARPDYVPEKFWDVEGKKVNVEAMAKSYAELEQKQSKPEPKPEDKKPEDKPADDKDKKPEDKPEDKKADDPANKPEFTPYFDEFAKDGKLSDASYEQLAAKGFPKDMVDVYIRGAQATASEANTPIYSAAGGTADDFNRVATWAAAQADEATKGLVERFNKSAQANDGNAPLVMKEIVAAMEAAEGKPAARRVGTTSTPTSGEPAYRSIQEASKAMEDPRYRTDAAYREDVIARMRNMPA